MSTKTNVTPVVGTFRDLKLAVQRRFNQMKEQPLFRADVDRDELWTLYLSSFPAGSNPTFRERTEHDCSCCRAFVKQAGAMVSIVDGELTSIWDIEVPEPYQTVVDALASYVKSKAIENVFLYSEPIIGTDKNFEETESGQVLTWEHFHITLPRELIAQKATIGTKLGDYRASHDVVLRSLREITPDAVETVLDLIYQNSLYRGDEKKNLVEAFRTIQSRFPSGEAAQDLFAWSQVIGLNAWVCRIRNDVIGTLLVDLSEGVDLEKAVKSFEDKVSGTNYKRPTSLITPKMRDAAKEKLVELGLFDALERRYARLEDIKVSNVLYADRNAVTRMSGDVFDELPTKAGSTKTFDKVEEIPIDKFLADVLPGATSLEVFFENRHQGNLVSLIAPQDLTAKSLFKWDNPFSWSYNGDVADSIKERVKSAGGNVTGELCCRLAWSNYDDLDFHMREPDDYEIYFPNKGRRSPSGGVLDVDMNAGDGTTRQPVENIYYTKLSTMKYGVYKLFVHQYCRRETTDPGFDVEIDLLGQVHRFSYPKVVSGAVHVAELLVSTNGVEIKPVLASSQAKRNVWSIDTQEFHPVTAVMLSPNYWDDNGSRATGNKHYFFMVDGCRNDGSARGFYNEFLKSDLEPHRKTMEIVGSRMRTEESGDQMSGLGFSSTQRNGLVVKVTGSFKRAVKVVF